MQQRQLSLTSRLALSTIFSRYLWIDLDVLNDYEFVKKPFLIVRGVKMAGIGGLVSNF